MRVWEAWHVLAISALSFRVPGLMREWAGLFRVTRQWLWELQARIGHLDFVYDPEDCPEDRVRELLLLSEDEWFALEEGLRPRWGDFPLLPD